MSYHLLKEKAIIDINSEDCSIVQKNYNSSFNLDQLIDIRNHYSFQQIVDDLPNPYLYYDFSTPPVNGNTLNDVYPSLYNAVINTGSGVTQYLSQGPGKQNQYQYHWDALATPTTDYLDLKAFVTGLDSTGYTISFWYQTNNVGRTSYIFYDGKAGATYQDAFISIIAINNTIIFNNSDGTTLLTSNQVSGDALIAYEMAHWAFVRMNDPSDTTKMYMYIYKNGVLLQEAHVTRYNFTGTQEARINSSLDTTTTYSNNDTYMENFRIYAQPYSTNDIFKLYSLKPKIGDIIYSDDTYFTYRVTSIPYYHGTVQKYVTDIPNVATNYIGTDLYEYAYIGQGYQEFNINSDVNVSNVYLVDGQRLYKIESVTYTGTTIPTHQSGVVSYDNNAISYDYMGVASQWQSNVSFNQNDVIYVTQTNTLLQVTQTPIRTTVTPPNFKIKNSTEKIDSVFYKYIAEYGIYLIGNANIYDKYIIDNGNLYEVIQTPFQDGAGQVTELLPPQSLNPTLFAIDSGTNIKYTHVYNAINWEQGLQYIKGEHVIYDGKLYVCDKGSYATLTRISPNTYMDYVSGKGPPLADTYKYTYISEVYPLTVGDYVELNNLYSVHDANIKEYNIWIVTDVSTLITKFEPIDTTIGNDVYYSDGFEYETIGEGIEWTGGDVYYQLEYVISGSNLFQVLNNTSNVISTEFPQDGVLADGYEYKIITSNLIDWNINLDGLYVDDYIYNPNNGHIYKIKSEGLIHKLPVSTVVNTTETTGDGYMYSYICSYTDWQPSLTLTINQYVNNTSNRSIYQVININTNSIQLPTLTTGSYTYLDDYSYKVLGPYIIWTTGTQSLSENQYFLTYNSVASIYEAYYVYNIVKYANTPPLFTSGSQLLDNTITYKYLGTLNTTSLDSEYSIHLQIPFYLSPNAKLAIYHFSMLWDGTDSLNTTYSTDRIEIYTPSIAARNVFYSKNTNRGIPLIRLFFDGSKKGSTTFTNGDLDHNSIIINDTNFLRNMIRFNVRTPLTNTQTGYVLNNDGTLPSTSWNMRLIVFDVDEEELKHQSRIVKPPPLSPVDYSLI